MILRLWAATVILILRAPHRNWIDIAGELRVRRARQGPRQRQQRRAAGKSEDDRDRTENLRSVFLCGHFLFLSADEDEQH